MKVFISYSRIDAKDTANVIHSYLTEFGHHQVFVDTSNIPYGVDWNEVIRKEIINCDIFVIIITPSALYRSEVEKEVELAKNLNKKIIPCVAKNYVEEDEIKWELNKYQGFFFESDSKLAMDLHRVIKQRKTADSLVAYNDPTLPDYDTSNPNLSAGRVEYEQEDEPYYTPTSSSNAYNDPTLPGYDSSKPNLSAGRLEYRGSNTPAAQIISVNEDYDVLIDNLKGILIHVAFNVQGLRGRRGSVAAYFHYSQGVALNSKDEKYSDTTGHVCVALEFIPSYEETNYSDFQLFMPYTGLNMAPGESKLIFFVNIWDMSIIPPRYLATSPGYEFAYSS